jgi:hypothetical protein
MPPLQAGRNNRPRKPDEAVWPAAGSPDPRHRIKAVTARDREPLTAEF